MSRVDIRKIRKEEIVDVATRLVAKRGWQNTTLADIAREVGVSVGVITYHFTNKDEIIKTVMEEYVGRNIASRFRTLEAIEDEADRLRGLIRMALRMTKQNRDMYHVLFDYWAKISWDEEIREMNAQFYDFARNWTAGCIRSGMRNGRFKKVDAREAAALVTALILGIQVQHVFDPDASGIRKAARAAEKVILDYLLA